jgi:A/G-specific adenine glycosylase
VTALGDFPRTLDGLRALPGIGPYTSAAIGAIAFGIPVVPIDGNVERVASRMFAITTPLPASKPEIAAAAARLGDDDAARARPSDFAQALFDLGASLCSPTQPACGICPWRGGCEAQRLGVQGELPRKSPKAARPLRHGVHFCLIDSDGQVLLRRRPPKGLYGGMSELPGTPWRGEIWALDEALEHAPMRADWREIGMVEHGLTHFELHISVLVANVTRVQAEGFLCAPDALAEAALPSVMRKCLKLALR